MISETQEINSNLTAQMMNQWYHPFLKSQLNNNIQLLSKYCHYFLKFNCICYYKRRLKKQTSNFNSKEENNDCEEDESNNLSDDDQTEEKDEQEQSASNNEEKEKLQTSIQSINPNIIKNVLKSFFNFLTDTKNQEIIHEFVSKKPYAYTLKIIKKFIKQYKFNNYFLVRLLRNKGYLKVLEYYLTFDVAEWMSQSKIVDVQSHYKCIEFLKECCVNKKIIETIHTYKKKP